MSRKYFDKIGCLRTIAFLGIAFSHMGIKYNWMPLSLSIFFTLSGFLSASHYLEQDLDISLASRFRFAVKKIKKLYFLHLGTMLLVFLYMVFKNILLHVELKEWLVLGIQLFLNTFLLQAWVPIAKYTVSLNGVAWYLSATFFMYFMFPRLLTWIKRLKTKKSLVFAAFGGILFQLILLSVVMGIGRLDASFKWWLTVNFPVFRLVDFFVGCILAKLYEDIKGKYTEKRNIYEIMWAILTVGIVFIQKRTHEDIFSQIISNSTTVYILLSVGWIYFFAEGNGIVVRLCDNKIFQYLGKISAYLYLIHGAVTILYNELIGVLGFKVEGIWWYPYWFVEFALYLVLTILYVKLTKKDIG